MATRARCRAVWEAGARQTADSFRRRRGQLGLGGPRLRERLLAAAALPTLSPLSTRLPAHLHLVSAGRGPAALDVSDALILGRCGLCTARHRLL